jgi:hypothetical protein
VDWFDNSTVFSLKPQKPNTFQKPVVEDTPIKQPKELLRARVTQQANQKVRRRNQS